MKKNYDSFIKKNYTFPKKLIVLSKTEKQKKGGFKY